MTTDPKKIASSAKPSLSIVPLSGLAHVSAACRHGAVEKGYGVFNWRENTIDAMEYIRAILSHAVALQGGEDLTPDGMVHHMAAIGATALIYLDAMESGTLNDDRPRNTGAEQKAFAAVTERNRRVMSGDTPKEYVGAAAEQPEFLTSQDISGRRPDRKVTVSETMEREALYVDGPWQGSLLRLCGFSRDEEGKSVRIMRNGSTVETAGRWRDEFTPRHEALKWRSKEWPGLVVEFVGLVPGERYVYFPHDRLDYDEALDDLSWCSFTRKGI